MRSRDLFLAVLTGGPVLGILAGLATDTTMQPPPEPSWRKVRPDVIFTSAQDPYVSAMPVDFGPPLYGETRIMRLARRFAADADELGSFYPPLGEETAPGELLPDEPLPATHDLAGDSADAADSADRARRDAGQAQAALGDAAAAADHAPGEYVREPLPLPPEPGITVGHGAPRPVAISVEEPYSAAGR